MVEREVEYGLGKREKWERAREGMGMVLVDRGCRVCTKTAGAAGLPPHIKENIALMRESHDCILYTSILLCVHRVVSDTFFCKSICAFH